MVFFTNQAGIEKGNVKPETVKDKVEAMIKELEIPVQVSQVPVVVALTSWLVGWVGQLIVLAAC